jgi:protein ImuB
MARRLLSLWFPSGLPEAGAAAGTTDDRLTALALWCQCYTPMTAIDPPDGITLDITGCAHLFGGEAGLRARILQRFPGARLAIANTGLAAWGLARYGEAPAGGPGSEDLAPLPIAALNLPRRAVLQLRRVGVRRIGELARLPRAELTSGYGPEPPAALARALGQAPEPRRFLQPPPEYRVAEHYAEPLLAPAQLQAALARLAEALCIRLAAAELGAVALAARCYRVDALRPELSLGFASPSRDAAQFARLLKEKLQGLDPGFGVEAISLEAAVERLVPAQHGLAPAVPDYVKPIDTLLNRLGDSKIWRVAPHASHIPEYAARRIGLRLAPAPWIKPRYPRPLRLLAQPDPIRAIAPVPDDPPVFFAWRGGEHRIVRATGPERIARDWWCHPYDAARPEAEKIRDYYAVEDTAGGRFWVFRAGLHGGAAPVRWYLHGFFG